MNRSMNMRSKTDVRSNEPPSNNPLSPSAYLYSHQTLTANNDVVTTEDGERLIDLTSGNGTCLLGHNHKEVQSGLIDALRERGPLVDYNILQETKAALTTHLNKSSPRYSQRYKAEVIYSSGMEAVEFSLRCAAEITGRRRFAGFHHSMHGKSLATSSLGWYNTYSIDQCYRIPWNDLNQLEALFDSVPIAAFILEPIRGSFDGSSLTPLQLKALMLLCRKYGVLFIADEILTGYYRSSQTASLLLNQLSTPQSSTEHEHPLSLEPDILIFGKSISNGFPASVVFLSKTIEVTSNMRPNSTYANNRLACSSIIATLNVMDQSNVQALTTVVDATVSEMIAPLKELGFQLQGRGALWLLSHPSHPKFSSTQSINQLVQVLRQRGYILTHTQKAMRIMPPATIPQKHLQQSLEVISETLQE